MKRIKSFVYGMLLLSPVLFALPSSAYSPENLKETLAKQLKSEPGSFTEQRAVVYVSFEIGQDGKVTILELNGSDANSLNFVKKKLQEINADDLKSEAGKTYYYKINFNKV